LILYTYISSFFFKWNQFIERASRVVLYEYFFLIIYFFICLFIFFEFILCLEYFFIVILFYGVLIEKS
jgi:hypothetical protein